MHRDHQINLNSHQYLSKRNNTFLGFDIQEPSFPKGYFQNQNPTSFRPLKLNSPPFPVFYETFNEKHHYDSIQKMKSSLIKQVSANNSLQNYFNQNMDIMETKIFGRKIMQHIPRWKKSEKFNEKKKMNLNFTKEFEKLNDSLYMPDFSEGAEDSNCLFSVKRRLSINKSVLSGGVSNRSTNQIKTNILKKSHFLNEFEIQNNFNGISKEMIINRTQTLKKVKSSMNITIPFKRTTLSDDNDVDMKTVLKKFKKKQNMENLIKPRVYNLHRNQGFGSKRTVQSRNNPSEFSKFKKPQIYPQNSDREMMRPRSTLFSKSNFRNQRNNQEFRTGFEQGMKFIQQNQHKIYMNQNPYNDQNTLFKKIVTSKPQPKKQSEAAQHIYKIMKNLSKIIYDRTLRRDKERLRKDIQKCLVDVDIKMNHLIGLKNLLSKFMKEEQITQKDMNLSNLEILLFCLFLVKKRYLDLEALRWTPECLNQFRNQEMLKRSEQNYKVVLKRAFKTLISTFNAENSILGGNENEFYEYYFGEVSKEFGISLDSFKPQQIFNEIKSRKQTKKFEKRKSKKEFASMLKKSAGFMDLLQRYLKDDLTINKKKEGIFIDCMKELDRKLPLMIFNWQKRLGNENNFKNEFIKFLVETLVNDKVKLPWSASEVRRGVSSVLRLFRKA